MVRQNKASYSLDKCILGTAGLGGVWGRVDSLESVRTILEGLDNGITAIDTAPAYGDAELYIGKALREWQRAKPLISTKVGRLKSFAADEGYYDYSPESMERSVQQSLQTMQLEQLDLLFLHDPGAIPPHEVERVLDTLQSFKQKGYTRQLGLGGNAPEWFKPYVSPEVFDVLMEYNRLNACCTAALNDTLPYCLANKMKYYAASPLYMGLLGKRFKEFTNDPPAWLSAEAIQTALKLNELAQRYQLSLSTLAHRFLLAVTDEVSIVIGAANSEQLKLTINDLRGELKPELLEEIFIYLHENNTWVQ